MIATNDLVPDEAPPTVPPLASASTGFAATLRRAAWIGRGGQPEVTYTSLFLAVVHGPGPLGRWASATLAAIGPRVADVLERWAGRGKPPGFEPDRLDAAAHIGDDELPPLPGERDLSESVRETLARAARIAHHVGTRGPFEDRHVLAVMLLDPPGHLDEYAAWRLDRSEWTARFLRHVVAAYADEGDAWQKLHAEQSGLGYSDGLLEAFAWATLVGGQREPPASELDGALILAGMLLQGNAHPAQDLAGAWLLGELGGDLTGLLGPMPDSRRLPMGDHLPLGGEAASLVARATPLTRSTPDGKLRVRHLLGAILAAPPSPELDELCTRGKRSRAGLAEGLYAWIERGEALAAPGERDDLGAWRALLGLPAPGSLRLPTYHNDDPYGPDMLGIGRDVDALAAVLASRHITPPLSVGLFGEWGSGKSFFMHKLEKRIATLAEASGEAEAAGEPSSYFGRIVQIKFNAWQYMDANLWASIGTHVFEQLREALDSQEKQEKLDAYAATLSSMQEREAELSGKAEALAGDAARVGAELERLRGAREQRQLGWKDTVATIREAAFKDAKVRVPLDAAAAKLGLPAAELTLERARAERESLRGFVDQAGAWVRALRGSWPKTVLALFLVLEPVLALLIRVITPSLPDWSTWPAVFAPALAMLAWINGRIGPVAGLIDNAIARARAAEDDVRAKLSVEEQKLKAQEAALAAEQVGLEQQRAALLARKSEIEAELATLRTGKSFRQVVLERAASDDYRKQLGVISTAHRDFVRLAELLGDRRDEPYVERIVLYIDDLDRCPPARVVEVLQAVHLLLSLPLFVVVVAVDSRWLLQSLEAYYAQQFHFSRSERTEWESKPQHYLEKIFQTPFALPPMSSDGFGSYVQGLLRARPAGAGEKPSAAKEGPRPPVEGPRARGTVPPEGAVAPNGPVAPRGPQLFVQDAPRRPRLDLTPRSLEIDEREIEYLCTLAPLVSSPRAAKRFVNLYRILRASVDDAGLDEFVAGRFKAIQLCLASVIGHPALAAQLFQAIFEERVRCPTTLDAFLTERLEHDDRWRDLAGQLKNRPELSDWPAVRRAVIAAARYSFETGRILRALPPSHFAAEVIRVG